MDRLLETISVRIARRKLFGSMGRSVVAVGLGLAGATRLERQAAIASFSCPCCWKSDHTGACASQLGQCNPDCCGPRCVGFDGCSCPPNETAQCVWYCCAIDPVLGNRVKKCLDCYAGSVYECTLYGCWSSTSCTCTECKSAGTLCGTC